MERIHVTVRARPLSPEDAKSNPWRISGNSICSNHSSKFEFDQIFGEDCKTADVYEARTKEIVSAAVRGFNGTVFAYGQTNSGKTHTMRGSAIEPGVIPLAVHDLFDILQEDMGREFLLRMSYMEIYNEEINDLLAPEHRKLQIHENLERGIYVAGLREEIVASPEQVLDLMEFGESHRHIGETNMNLYSSRSHTIFRMIIESRHKNEDEDVSSPCDAVRVSVLNLVDLAGSERAAKTGAEGVRLKEGSHINKSLMTLGTVIKKLSEGAESQGGHVPYRDSKLTRILQPALGGNANTAIICNITLAQIHADETKSSLQFASRALRVTNCAHVNEILTDAALLKRQKKEIEELRAKLQGSHSEHLGEDILNLRNTLLQTELERERIALELEEEKKAQVERERRLQEQAKRIENLSSMVLYSNRDENRDHNKKKNRRDTWCPGNLLRGTPSEACSTAHLQASAVKPMRHERDFVPLFPFEELVNETQGSIDDLCKKAEKHNNNDNVLEDCTLPDPRALLHVTNRRKGPVKKKSLVVKNNELIELQSEYEELLLNYETQRTISEIQIDCLIRKLTEVNLSSDVLYNDHPSYHLNKSTVKGDRNITSRESDAILVIKQLQEQIMMLENEKSSSQQSLDSVVELATEQNICAREKYEELYQELLNAREEIRVAREQLTSIETARPIDEGNFEYVMKLSMEVQDILSEVQGSKSLVENLFSFVNELFESFPATLKIVELKSLTCQSTGQLKSTISNYEKVHCYMKHKVTELESKKLLLYNQSDALHKQIEDLKLTAENSEKALKELVEQQDLEKSELFSHIQMLEKEISCLSSCSMAKEKENLRKDLEKTKSKLKEAESKLKNVIQEKTKLEGEKAFAERELKQLHGQKTLLERDISKRDSFAGRRRDSVAEKSSKVFDPKRGKGYAIPFETMQEDYRKLEVLAFEMEATIASLEEQLAVAHGEREESISRNEILASELESLSCELNISHSELSTLQEEISSLRLRLEQSESDHERMKSSINMLVEEKEELATHLTDALLEMEEEKAIWSAKEKVSIEAIEEKAKSYNAEVVLLSKGITEVTNELESCKEECKILKERLTSCEEIAERESQGSMEKSLEINQLKYGIKVAEDESKRSQENWKSNMEMISFEYHQACEKVDKLQKELSLLNKEKEDISIQMTELNRVSNLSEDFQNLKDQLLIMTKERDKLVAQIEDQRSHVGDVEVLRKSYDDRLYESNDQVEKLTRWISDLEVKMHNDDVKNSKEMAKHRMRLHWTKAKLEVFRGRHKEAVDELDLMNEKYKEAAGKLKDKLSSSLIENLNLKKQLATAKGQ